MTHDDFDPYFKWMGIPPSEQPPNYYRLLGIPHYTFDEDVIENAADQRMNHLRSFQSGKNSDHSQRLLNEVAKAKVCLLNAEERSAYDKRLRQREAPLQKVARLIPTASPAVQPAAASASEEPAFSPLFSGDSPGAASSGKRPGRSKQKSPAVEGAKIVAGGIAGLAIGYVIMCYLNPAADFLGLMSGGDPGGQVVQNDPDNDRLRSVPPPPVVVPPIPDPVPPAVAPIGTPPVPNDNRPDPAQANNTPAADPTDSPAEAPSPVIEPDVPSQSRLQQLQIDREAAQQRGEVHNTLRLIREIARLEESDPLTPQTEAINTFFDNGGDAVHFVAVAQEALTVAETAIADGRADIATSLKNTLLFAARQSENPELIRKATLCVVKLGEVGNAP